jgi:hypothetical protein
MNTVKSFLELFPKMPKTYLITKILGFNDDDLEEMKSFLNKDDTYKDILGANPEQEEEEGFGGLGGGFDSDMGDMGDMGDMESDDSSSSNSDLPQAFSDTDAGLDEGVIEDTPAT